MNRKDNIWDKYRCEINEAWNDLKDPKRRYRQIPNLLTCFRILAPLFIIPSVFTGNLPLIIGLITGFSLTDFVDGFTARKYGLTSDLGKDLDAISDKVFALTLLVASSVLNPYFLANIFLETIILAINVNRKIHGHETKSSMMGKIKTWFLFSLAGAGILSPVYEMSNLLKVLMPTTIFMQLMTIGSYLKQKSNAEKKSTLKVIDAMTNHEVEVGEKGEKDLIKKPKIVVNELDELKQIRAMLTEDSPREVEDSKVKIKTMNRMHGHGN